MRTKDPAAAHIPPIASAPDEIAHLRPEHGGVVVTKGLAKNPYIVGGVHIRA